MQVRSTSRAPSKAAWSINSHASSKQVKPACRPSNSMSGVQPHHPLQSQKPSALRKHFASKTLVTAAVAAAVVLAACSGGSGGGGGSYRPATSSTSSKPTYTQPPTPAPTPVKPEDPNVVPKSEEKPAKADVSAALAQARAEQDKLNSAVENALSALKAKESQFNKQQNLAETDAQITQARVLAEQVQELSALPEENQEPSGIDLAALTKQAFGLTSSPEVADVPSNSLSGFGRALVTQNLVPANYAESVGLSSSDTLEPALAAAEKAWSDLDQAGKKHLQAQQLLQRVKQAASATTAPATDLAPVAQASKLTTESLNQAFSAHLDLLTLANAKVEQLAKTLTAQQDSLDKIKQQDISSADQAATEKLTQALAQSKSKLEDFRNQQLKLLQAGQDTPTLEKLERSLVNLEFEYLGRENDLLVKRFTLGLLTEQAIRLQQLDAVSKNKLENPGYSQRLSRQAAKQLLLASDNKAKLGYNHQLRQLDWLGVDYFAAEPAVPNSSSALENDKTVASDLTHLTANQARFHTYTRLIEQRNQLRQRYTNNDTEQAQRFKAVDRATATSIVAALNQRRVTGSVPLHLGQIWTSKVFNSSFNDPTVAVAQLSNQLAGSIASESSANSSELPYARVSSSSRLFDRPMGDGVVLAVRDGAFSDRYQNNEQLRKGLAAHSPFLDAQGLNKLEGVPFSAEYAALGSRPELAGQQSSFTTHGTRVLMAIIGKDQAGGFVPHATVHLAEYKASDKDFGRAEAAHDLVYSAALHNSGVRPVAINHSYGPNETVSYEEGISHQAPEFNRNDLRRWRSFISNKPANFKYSVTDLKPLEYADSYTTIASLMRAYWGEDAPVEVRSAGNVHYIQRYSYFASANPELAYKAVNKLSSADAKFVGQVLKNTLWVSGAAVDVYVNLDTPLNRERAQKYGFDLPSEPVLYSEALKLVETVSKSGKLPPILPKLQDYYTALQTSDSIDDSPGLYPFALSTSQTETTSASVTTKPAGTLSQAGTANSGANNATTTATASAYGSNAKYSFDDYNSFKLVHDPTSVGCGMYKYHCLAGITTTVHHSFDRLEDFGELQTDVVTGTSFSAPQVTGVLGLISQQFPWMKAAELKTTLLTTATDVDEPGIDDYTGWGLYNVAAALRGPTSFFFGDFDADLSARKAAYRYNGQLNPTKAPNQAYYFFHDISGAGGLKVRGESTQFLYLLGQKIAPRGALQVSAANLVLMPAKAFFGTSASSGSDDFKQQVELAKALYANENFGTAAAGYDNSAAWKAAGDFDQRAVFRGQQVFTEVKVTGPESFTPPTRSNTPQNRDDTVLGLVENPQARNEVPALFVKDSHLRSLSVNNGLVSLEQASIDKLTLKKALLVLPVSEKSVGKETEIKDLEATEVVTAVRPDATVSANKTYLVASVPYYKLKDITVIGNNLYNYIPSTGYFSDNRLTLTLIPKARSSRSLLLAEPEVHKLELTGTNVAALGARAEVARPEVAATKVASTHALSTTTADFIPDEQVLDTGLASVYGLIAAADNLNSAANQGNQNNPNNSTSNQNSNTNSVKPDVVTTATNALQSQANLALQGQASFYGLAKEQVAGLSKRQLADLAYRAAGSVYGNIQTIANHQREALADNFSQQAFFAQAEISDSSQVSDVSRLGKFFTLQYQDTRWQHQDSLIKGQANGFGFGVGISGKLGEENKVGLSLGATAAKTDYVESFNLSDLVGLDAAGNQGINDLAASSTKVELATASYLSASLPMLVTLRPFGFGKLGMDAAAGLAAGLAASAANLTLGLGITPYYTSYQLERSLQDKADVKSEFASGGIGFEFLVGSQLVNSAKTSLGLSSGFDLQGYVSTGSNLTYQAAFTESTSGSPLAQGLSFHADNKTTADWFVKAGLQAKYSLVINNQSHGLVAALDLKHRLKAADHELVGQLQAQAAQVGSAAASAAATTITTLTRSSFKPTSALKLSGGYEYGFVTGAGKVDLSLTLSYEKTTNFSSYAGDVKLRFGF